MVIYYIRKKKEYLNLTEKVITEIGFGFRIHSPNSSLSFLTLFYFYYLLYHVYYLLLYYYQGCAECRFKDLLFFSDLMRVSLSKEPNKRTQRTQKNRLTYACSERNVSPNFGMSEVTRASGKQAEQICGY